MVLNAWKITVHNSFRYNFDTPEHLYYSSVIQNIQTLCQKVIK